jgi:predicted NBD/HSP70 family sugar kinase
MGTVDIERVILAVDIGGSKYVVGIISETGKIITKERYVWNDTSTKGITNQIISVIEKFLCNFSDSKISAIGITIPGLADPSTGMWISSSYFGLKNLPIVRIIQGNIPLPVYIDNDAKACALAEKWLGTGINCNDFLYMTVSTGVGGAFFLNGDLYYGGYGNAGEVGECVIVENGRLSKNGRRGTLEMYASTTGLVKNYIEAGGREKINGQELNGAVLSFLAEKGDKSALVAFEQMGYSLGLVIATACNMLNIKKVIIGGGLSLAFIYFKMKLEETVLKNYYSKTDPIVIEPSSLGYDGALLGAAALALRGINRI